MKNILLTALYCTLLLSCNNFLHETIHGSGNFTTETRDVSPTNHIESRGNFNVRITQGNVPSVKVEADANLLPYIITQRENGKLVIKTKDNVNLSSIDAITVYITTDRLEEVELEGSGNISGEGKFTGSDHLKLSIAGTGDITIDVNTPKVNCSIAGTGTINVSGETKDSRVDIAGVGDYKAVDLRSENVDIDVAGSGNAWVYAENSLNVSIAGSGNVYYKGTPATKSHTAGSGHLSQIQ